MLLVSVMSRNSGTRIPSKVTGKYFQRAEFDSDWPFQFLAMIIGVVLVIFEGSLALWPLFYGATPLLSLIFLYWMALHYDKYMPILAAFFMGIIGDILFSDLIGGRALAYMLIIYVMQYRRQRLLQSEFIEIWTDFAIMTGLIFLFQFVMFSSLNLAIPSATPMMFQIGVTVALFPIGYVILFTIFALLQKVKLQR